MRNSENVLNSLAGHSSDLNYKFERLYRLLFNENLYALAYQNIAPNEGSCTTGADGQKPINGCPEIQATAQKELTDRQ